MAESKLRALAMDFSVKTIKLCETIKGHYSLVNQLERSSTSIGANIHEANYAHSKADFAPKFCRGFIWGLQSRVPRKCNKKTLDIISQKGYDSKGFVPNYFERRRAGCSI